MPTVTDFDQLRFIYRGPYASDTTYELNDVVSYANSLYCFTANVATAGVTPTNATPWALMVNGYDASVATSGATSAVATALANNPNVEARTIGGRLAQLVETRSDGTTNTTTLTWSNDLVTKAAQNNPARTFTFTYSGTSLTGWSVS